MAKIQLNGKKITIKTNLSLLDLLKKHKLNDKNSIELNDLLFLKLYIKKEA